MKRVVRPARVEGLHLVRLVSKGLLAMAGLPARLRSVTAERARRALSAAAIEDREDGA